MADQKPTRRRLSLMEAYGSFSDEHLQNVARKIKEMGVRIDDSVDDSVDQRIDQIGDSVDDQPALLTINQALLYSQKRRVQFEYPDITRLFSIY